MTRKMIGLLVAVFATMTLVAAPATAGQYEYECEEEQSVECSETDLDGFGNSRRKGNTWIATVTATNPFHVDAQLVIMAQRGQGFIPNSDAPVTLSMVFVDDTYTTTFEVPSWRPGGAIIAEIEGCDGVTVDVEVEKVA